MTDHHNAHGLEMTSLVLAIAGEVLERTDLSPDDDFFLSGGDSMLAMHLVGRLARATGLSLRVSTLIANPVLSEFTELMTQARDAEPLRAGDGDTPLAAALRAALPGNGGGRAL